MEKKSLAQISAEAREQAKKNRSITQEILNSKEARLALLLLEREEWKGEAAKD